MTTAEDLRARLTTPHSKVKLVFPRALREELERECGFTDDELEILRLCGRGWSYVQIADERHCSVETVRNRIRGIKNKIAAVIKKRAAGSLLPLFLRVRIVPDSKLQQILNVGRRLVPARLPVLNRAPGNPIFLGKLDLRQARQCSELFNFHFSSVPGGKPGSFRFFHFLPECAAAIPPRTRQSRFSPGHWGQKACRRSRRGSRQPPHSCALSALGATHAPGTISARRPGLFPARSPPRTPGSTSGLSRKPCTFSHRRRTRPRFQASALSRRGLVRHAHGQLSSAAQPGSPGNNWPAARR